MAILSNKVVVDFCERLHIGPSETKEIRIVLGIGGGYIIARDYDDNLRTFRWTDPGSSCRKKLCEILGINSKVVFSIEINLKTDDVGRVLVSAFAEKEFLDIPLPANLEEESGV